MRRDGVLTATYEYDLNGNRTRLTTPGGTVTGSYDAQDRLLSYGTTSYGYDRAGALAWQAVGADTTRYSYDALGNLTQATLPDGTSLSYLLDAQNRRIGKRVNGGLTQGFLYQGQLTPVAELDSLNQVVSRFVYATRVNVPDYLLKGGQTYRLLLDHLGSVRLVVNTADGSVAQRLDYDEFGRVIQNTNPGFQPFGYAGGLLDAHTGLVRFGARDYAPTTGRWTAKDPLGFGGGDANLYAYVGNEPVNRVDPTGLYVTQIVAGVLGGSFSVLSLYISSERVTTGQVISAFLVGASQGVISTILPSVGLAGFGANFALASTANFIGQGLNTIFAPPAPPNFCSFQPVGMQNPFGKSFLSGLINGLAANLGGRYAGFAVDRASQAFLNSWMSSVHGGLGDLLGHQFDPLYNSTN